MRKLLICCGMPRSGTTFAAQRIMQQYSLPEISPEEARFLTNRDIMLSIKSLGALLYRQCLTDQFKGVKYSSWGDEDYFIGGFALSMINVITSLSHRDYIERDTISPEYEKSINSIRNNIYSMSQENIVVLKQPGGEIYHKDIENLFSDRLVLYAICLRDPYLVFCSNMEWGWVSGLQGFLENLEISYRSTIEILRLGRGMVILVDQQKDKVAKYFLRIGEMLSIDSNLEELFIHEIWSNKGTRLNNVITRDEFYYYYNLGPCKDLEEEIHSFLVSA